MRSLAWALLLLVSTAVSAGAQGETRGNISGTVRDAQGVIPGATVKVINVDTNGTRTLVTNERGYYEAGLLNAGNYRVEVEMPGFKKVNRPGIDLGAAQSFTVDFTLEVGAVTESVTVAAESPLLDTTTVSSGQNFDRRMVEGLPVFSNMPIMLSRFTPGVAPSDEAPIQNIFQGYMEGTTYVAGGQVGTGTQLDSRNTGNNYTIDGASNNGFGRRIASSPNSDQIQEVRVETSNFDASQGYGTGLTVAMVTRGGTNRLNGSANYTHWNNRFNSPNLLQKVAFAQNPRDEEAFRKGRSHIGAFTLGGPIVIPKVIDGRGKAFFFANFSKSDDSAPGRAAGNSTIPANRKHLEGDFSDLLQLPHGRGATTPLTHHQYQIYDPLTTRPDPARPGRVIRDPFPNNIIPKNRFMNPDGSYKNPAFAIYQALVPEPNQNFISPTQAPVNNYYRASQPDRPHNTQASVRVDVNASENDRFFIRVNGNKFLENLEDQFYATTSPVYKDLMDLGRARYSWSVTGTWTKVVQGNTVIDTQIAANRAHQRDTRFNLVKYKPTDIGLPSYLNDFCEARFECILPQQNIGGYSGFGGTVDGGIWTTNYQAQSNLTNVRGSHTWRGGIDYRIAMRKNRDGSGNMGSFNYGQDYTRAADTTNVFPAQNIGLSLAAFMMGLPSSVSISDESGFNISNNWFGTFVQDTWRVSRNLTLNYGLRFEWENGIKERDNRMLLWFDPEAETSVAALAEAAYARNPIPEIPVSQFDLKGGAIHVGAPGYDDRTHKPEGLWMPRASFGYRIGERNVLKGGYGMFFDTVNARDFNAGGVDEGFDVTTTNNLSNDSGLTFALGDPRNGILPLVDPFPVRGNRGRFDVPLGTELGVDTMFARGFTAENPNRTHSRVQRWRLGVQREVSRGMAVEVAYAGSYADRQGISIRQDYLPEQYWSDANVRDTSANDYLTQTVPNPFFIGNFASLQTTNPILYQRLAGATSGQNSNTQTNQQQIQRQRLLRAFPHMNGLNYQDQPLGEVKTHSLEFVLNHRYTNGLSANAALALNRVKSNRTVHEYDREPTLWQTNNNGRPWRVTTAAVYELPFGPGKPWLADGGLVANVARGWTLGATFDYQPGALLNWNDNRFFYGDLKDIPKDNPEIALRPDGTFDPTKTWFNIDAGFERDTADQPAGFQKRQFPFRVEGLRNFPISVLNANVSRTFDLGSRRSILFRVSAQNLLNRQHYSDPNLDPTSTNFGQVRGVTQAVMRFITFDTTFRF